MSQPFDASKSLTTLEQDSTIIAVIEMSQSRWLVAAVVPGVERQPLKKIEANEEALLKLLHRWRTEAGQAGREIKRIVAAYEAGRDGFWLARWLRARHVEAYVIHPASVAVSREHRRAKTDRLDTELLMRAFLGWLRGEKRHCSMAAIPTVAEEDARRPNRERGNLVTERTRIVNQMKAILARFGIRTFRPTLRRAEEKLDALQATGMISWPALNQIVCALRFFFGVTLGQATIPERIAYAREPQKLPVVLSADEVVRFLEASPSRRASMAYGGMNAWDFVADARTTRVRMGRLRRNWHGMTQLPARALKNEWPTGQGSRRQRGAEPRVR